MFEKLAALLKEATISVLYNRREIKKIYLLRFPRVKGIHIRCSRFVIEITIERITIYFVIFLYFD